MEIFVLYSVYVSEVRLEARAVLPYIHIEFVLLDQRDDSAIVVCLKSV